jgi:hypothetical protein
MPSKRRAQTSAVSKKATPKNDPTPSSQARTTRSRASAARQAPVNDHTGEGSVANDSSEYLGQDDGEGQDDDQGLNSDALDEDDAPHRKRKRVSGGTKSPRKTPAQKRRKKDESDDDDYDEQEVDEGVEVVGKVVKAPKTGKGAL